MSEIDKKSYIKQIYFFHQEPYAGIDNIYAGPSFMMSLLAKSFHEHLDIIASNYQKTWYTEYLVYYEALRFNYEMMHTIAQKTCEIWDYVFPE